MNNDFALKPDTLLHGRRTYRIERVLGSGGFGITYLASFEMLVDNIPVTVKVAIKEHFSDDYHQRSDDHVTVTVPGTSRSKEMAANSQKDFQAEANRLASLPHPHPNIVRINEVFQANGTAYYVMEYLQGQSLKDYIDAHGPLDSSELRSLMTPVVDALAFLHDNRITHLDVKPANIMLTHNADGSVRPVLIDFGLSKHYDKDGMPTSTINLCACSAGFSPAEQYIQLQSFSPTADVYALGATMLAAAMGHRPFDACLRPANEPTASLERTSLDPGLKAVIDKAMSASPTDRYANARAMLKALDAGKGAGSEDATRAITANTDEHTTIIAAGGKSKPAMRNILIGILIAVIAAAAVFFIKSQTPEATKAAGSPAPARTADSILTQTQDSARIQTQEPADAPLAKETSPIDDTPAEVATENNPKNDRQDINDTKNANETKKPQDPKKPDPPAVEKTSPKGNIFGGAATLNRNGTISFHRPYTLQLNTLDDAKLTVKAGDQIQNAHIVDGCLVSGELNGHLITGLNEPLNQ